MTDQQLVKVLTVSLVVAIAGSIVVYLGYMWFMGWAIGQRE